MPPTDLRPVVVVFLGDCAGCDVGQVANNLRNVDLPAELRIVGLAGGTLAQLGFVKQSNPLASAYELLLKEPSQVAAYNAKWTPRVFLIDKAGALLYAQPEFVGVKTALWEVKERLLSRPVQEASS